MRSVLYNSVSLIGAYGLVNSGYLTFVVLQKKSNSSILSALKYEKLYFHKLSLLKFTQKRFILSNTELKAHNMYVLANVLVYNLQIIYVVKLVIVHFYFLLNTNLQSPSIGKLNSFKYKNIGEIFKYQSVISVNSAYCCGPGAAHPGLSWRKRVPGGRISCTVWEVQTGSPVMNTRNPIPLCSYCVVFPQTLSNNQRKLLKLFWSFFNAFWYEIDDFCCQR